jgi:hypothetical protein
VAACNPSFKRNKPLRIQLFTVPSGSFSASAISEWLKPSKYANSMARFCCGLSAPMSARTFSARRFSSSCCFEPRCDDHRRQFLGLLLAPALTLAIEAQGVEGAVASQGQKPGNERAAGFIVLRGVAPKCQENVLHNFLSGSRLLEDAQNQAVYSGEWRS